MPVKTVRDGLIGILMTSLLMTSLPAHAGIVSTEQMLLQETPAQAAGAVQTFIASEAVAAQLAAWGVAPEAVTARVAALSETELQQLALILESQPAGAGALEVVGLVFVILLILELVGVTNVFTAI